jgi:radical SAM protein with 4Fe4S-binding SPASM domain
MKQQLEEPFSFWIQATRACNLDCRLCYDDCSKQAPPGQLTKQEIEGVLDEVIGAGAMTVAFEGGEPLLREDFMEILEYTCPRALVFLRTNGTLIDAQVASELKRVGVGTVLLDVWGATAETHDYLTGSPGSFEKTLAAAAEVAGLGIDTYLTCIVNRHNYLELQGVLDLCAVVGARKLGVFRLYPIGRVRTNWEDLALPLEEQERAIAALVPPPGVQVMQSWHPKDRNCCWSAASIDAFGNSIGCSYLRELVNYGNVRDVPFMETWRHPLYVHLRENEVAGGCSDCAASEGRGGGCRSTAMAFKGSWNATDPFCHTTTDDVDLTRLPDWLRQRPLGPAEPSPHEVEVIR